MKIFYCPEYVRAKETCDTTRKARWIADALVRAPVRGIELAIPDTLTAEALRQVHAQGYVTAVQTGRPRDLAESQGFNWDPGVWPMLCASNGGVVAAARAALRDGVAGSLSSGLHHARREHGAGFCTFNGLALAARAAQAAGARRLLIIDLDAHCGGGTHELLQADPAIWHLDVAVVPYDSYAPTLRTTLDLVQDASAYLPTIAARLKALEQAAPPFDLCMYNAGMDPFEDDGVGGLQGITAAILRAREALVFEWCHRQRLPIAFGLAGGYMGSGTDPAELVALHRLTLEGALVCGE